MARRCRLFMFAEPFGSAALQANVNILAGPLSESSPTGLRSCRSAMSQTVRDRCCTHRMWPERPQTKRSICQPGSRCPLVRAARPSSESLHRPVSHCEQLEDRCRFDGVASSSMPPKRQGYERSHTAQSIVQLADTLSTVSSIGCTRGQRYSFECMR